MGTWGYGIYEDDMAEDTKEDYLGQLKLGKSDEDALHDFLESYAKDLEDEEDSAVIYLALADTMWKKGRLTQEIKDKAFEAMVRDLELGRWESEKDIRNRTKVLDKLKEKLNSPMPARKKIPVHKPYKLDMKEHDLYYYQINPFLNH